MITCNTIIVIMYPIYREGHVVWGESMLSIYNNIIIKGCVPIYDFDVYNTDCFYNLQFKSIFGNSLGFVFYKSSTMLTRDSKFLSNTYSLKEIVYTALIIFNIWYHHIYLYYWLWLINAHAAFINYFFFSLLNSYSIGK
jgi:hypothetical protein